MILPIYPYGSPILREETIPIEADSPALQQLIDDMVETMHAASGIGLAAPQIGRRERLFVVDLSAMAEDLMEELGEIPPWARAPMAFINPEIVEEDEGVCEYEEGCLSIPDIRELVARPDRVRVRFLDRDFTEHDIVAGGILARVIQHELDHLHGVLFIDHISQLRRKLLKRRLNTIARGEGDADYLLASPDAEPQSA
ncbi:MAG: peptide deformylase [Rhodothermales bacterium]